MVHEWVIGHLPNLKTACTLIHVHYVNIPFYQCTKENYYLFLFVHCIENDVHSNKKIQYWCRIYIILHYCYVVIKTGILCHLSWPPQTIVRLSDLDMTMNHLLKCSWHTVVSHGRGVGWWGNSLWTGNCSLLPACIIPKANAMFVHKYARHIYMHPPCINTPLSLR